MSDVLASLPSAPTAPDIRMEFARGPQPSRPYSSEDHRLPWRVARHDRCHPPFPHAPQWPPSFSPSAHAILLLLARHGCCRPPPPSARGALVADLLLCIHRAAAINFLSPRAMLVADLLILLTLGGDLVAGNSMSSD